jgi:branched-chain amino acid transport system ATP-binding protein
MATPDFILKTEVVTLRFGGITALNSVSIVARQGEITAIIGPNGAGKTSLLNCISGLYHPSEGRILFGDSNGTVHDLSKLPPPQIARLGVARSFQNIELFRGMTVLDNLMLGRHLHIKYDLFSSLIYWGRAQREEIQHRQQVEDIIDLLEIAAIRKKTVGSLPYGLQKRVELGRALALEPKLLLLDEPMAGMNTEEKEDMARFILDVHEERNLAIILIEHDMGVVMDISDRVAVLNFGKLIGQDTPAAIQENPEVIQAYLGKAETST